MRAIALAFSLVTSAAQAQPWAALPFGAAVPVTSNKTAQALPIPTVASPKLSVDIAETLTAEAKERGIRVDLAHAIALRESAGDPNALSSAGAVGVMQLMPKTAKRYGVTNRRDPLQSIRGGLDYLKDLLTLFTGNTRLAVAAYNAGEGAVIRYGRKVPPYRETRNYVASICSHIQC